MLRPSISTSKAAAILGVCEQTIRNLYHEGVLAGFPLKRKYLIFIDSLEAFQQRGNTPAQDVPLVDKPTMPAVRSRRRGVPVYDRHL